MLDTLGKSSSYPCFIMPERFAALPATTPLTEIVGSGPYRFVADERRAGEQVVYRRYDRYVPNPVGTPGVTAGPKLAFFERLEWRIIPDAATACAALQAGEIDWWERITADLRPLLARRRDLVIDRIETLGTVAMLRPNHLLPPFDDPAVRRALLPAMSQADFMAALFGEDHSLWRDGVGCFPPGSTLASDEGLEMLTAPRDLGRARAALAATGRAGAKVVMLHPATSKPTARSPWSPTTCCGRSASSRRMRPPTGGPCCSGGGRKRLWRKVAGMPWWCFSARRTC